MGEKPSVPTGQSFAGTSRLSHAQASSSGCALCGWWLHSTWPVPTSPSAGRVPTGNRPNASSQMFTGSGPATDALHTNNALPLSHSVTSHRHDDLTFGSLIHLLGKLPTASRPNGWRQTLCDAAHAQINKRHGQRQCDHRSQRRPHAGREQEEGQVAKQEHRSWRFGCSQGRFWEPSSGSVTCCSLYCLHPLTQL